MSRLGGFAFGMFAVIGCGFVSIYLHAQWLRYSSQSWIATPSEVLVSRVECCFGRSQATFKLQVAYKYQVGDDVHVGETVRFGDNRFSSGREANQLAQLYPVGSRPVVYVDPSNSRRSVLDRRELTEGPKDALALGLFTVAGGALLGLLLSRRRR
jgi:hypothetical protein